MRYAFHPEALQEYSEAVKYYAERSSDLAQRFINSVEETIFKIREYPNRYPTIEDDIRRSIIKKFPFSVIYLENQDLHSDFGGNAQ